jgi:hypothetical protein
MKTSSQKTIFLSAVALFAVVAIGWLVIYVLSGVSEAIALNGPRLIDLRKEWVRDGSPEPPPIKKYVAQWTDPDRFFVWTNVYTINGQTFQSLLAMNDPKFEDKGILVVSREGELIWVDSAKPPKLLKGER